MNLTQEKKEDLLERTYKRLKHYPLKSMEDTIAFLADEIEGYRAQIEHLMAELDHRPVLAKIEETEIEKENKVLKETIVKLVNKLL